MYFGKIAGVIPQEEYKKLCNKDGKFDLSMIVGFETSVKRKAFCIFAFLVVTKICWLVYHADMHFSEHLWEVVANIQGSNFVKGYMDLEDVSV